MGDRGASLVELTMVMGLVAVMVAFAGQSFVAAASRHQGRVVTAELMAELRAARILAITRRERVRVVFEPETARVRTERADSPGSLLRPVGDYHGRGIVVEGLSNGPAVVFYPSGRAATPTTITLRNDRYERWRVTVSMTGRVSRI